MQTQIPISEAVRMLGLHRGRFNEAVAAGHYPCAPEARHGAPRLFGEADMIALSHYADLIVAGYPPRLAGKSAASLMAKLGAETRGGEVSVMVTDAIEVKVKVERYRGAIRAMTTEKECEHEPA